MRKVRENLYISDLRGAEQQGHKFDTVITLSLSDPKDVENHSFSIQDNKKHDYETFKKAVEKTVESLESDKKTLVHCQAGISRSVSVASGALAIIEDKPVNEVVQDCEAPSLRPNLHLLGSAKQVKIEKNQTDLNARGESGR